ncbi:RNA polymerase sigma factor [Nocardia goodfellowii]|uniref:RNA polymerase sigma-70 factor (ECF subfamily) n=1 Tax=Nocardia goodfellowii TaxID=882446 RepID=A0ABS4QM78_9NOCA|nr:sigma-70 family RNA polymerase sigma factor [Nocardia goodfellowii]MBP2192801.1 RNA polymerase sigma-70 factor (ECF subfamily) [Nocardia goodfellowii]
MQPDNGRVLSEAAVEALLGAVLRECALEPLLLLDAARSGSALVRIARAGAAGPDPFDEILTDAYESTRREMIDWAAGELTPAGSAEGVVRTAFMRVYARRPDITDPGEMRAYLWHATEKLVRDTSHHHTADRLEPAGDEHIAMLADRVGVSFDDTITVRHMVIAALETIPQREREAVVLRGYEDSGYAEVARIMGSSQDAARSYVRDALARIHERLRAA